MKPRGFDPGVETDLFGGGAPSPARRAPRATPPPAPAPAPKPRELPPRPLNLMSPGDRLSAEHYLADVLGGEMLTYGGVLLDWPNGVKWVYVAAEQQHQTTHDHGQVVYTEADVEEARTEGKNEGEEGAWDEAKKLAEEVAAEAVDRTANLLLERAAAQIRRFRRPLISKRKRGRNGRRRKNVVWQLPDPPRLLDSERRELERDSFDAGWKHE